MKLRTSFLLGFCGVLASVLLAAQKVYSAYAECPTGNCLLREVETDGDEGDNSLRVVVMHACMDDGDDMILFNLWETIELDSPIVIPADCNGRLFIYGRPNIRHVVDGSGIGIGDDFTDNCILRVESDDNEITNLSFVNYRNGDDDEVEKRPGIGLCLIGNRNRVEHVSSGVAPESESAGNDVGVYISGNENVVLRSRISFNTLDGMWIEGDKNVIQGNYIADAEEDCSQPNPQETTDSALVDESKATEEISAEELVEPDVAEIVTPAEDAEMPSSAASAGGCQLITNSTNSITQSITQIITTPGVVVLDTEQPRNAKVESSTQVSEDELTTVRQAQSQSCLSISNGRYGIRITGGARENKIGGFTTGEHNIIAYNGDAGVRLDGTVNSVQNTINNNIFYHNGGLGIDAGPEKVTWNDMADVDEGPNTLVNFADNLKVIMRTLRVGGQNVYTFTLKGNAPVGSIIEAYLADGSGALEPLEEQGDPSGYGEGEVLLLHFVVQNKPEFEVNLPNIARRQMKVTTLLTDPEGNTSEFSQTLILEQDSDLDGIIDLYEDAQWNELVDGTESDPFNIDTDGDGLLDGIEDPNLNGKRDQGELPPMLADADKDGLSDYIETKGDGSFIAAENDTDPFTADTDADGLKDGEEDKNHDGVVEFHLGETDPRRTDSDGDGVNDKADNCPTMPNQSQKDRNNNHVGDVCEVVNNP